MESILEAYFQNEDGRPSWAYVRSIMRWPLAGPPVKLLLDSALGAGHVLVLYAYVDLKQADCLNIEEEQALGKEIFLIKF